MTQQAEIWKAVASGGRWTLNEVRTEVPNISHDRVRNAMWQMAQNGILTRFDDGRYGVTPECIVPLGVTVQDVLAVAGVARK